MSESRALCSPLAEGFHFRLDLSSHSWILCARDALRSRTDVPSKTMASLGFPASPKYLNLSSQTHTQMRSGQSTPRRPHSAPPRRASPQALQWDGIMTIHDRHSEQSFGSLTMPGRHETSKAREAAWEARHQGTCLDFQIFQEPVYQHQRTCKIL